MIIIHFEVYSHTDNFVLRSEKKRTSILIYTLYSPNDLNRRTDSTCIRQIENLYSVPVDFHVDDIPVAYSSLGIKNSGIRYPGAFARTTNESEPCQDVMQSSKRERERESSLLAKDDENSYDFVVRLSVSAMSLFSSENGRVAPSVCLCYVCSGQRC